MLLTTDVCSAPNMINKGQMRVFPAGSSACLSCRHGYKHIDRASVNELVVFDVQ